MAAANGTVGQISVHPCTTSPNTAWKQMERHQICRQADMLPVDTPVYEDKVRFVCVSDTHDRIDKMKHAIPAGDVLVHAGDFSFKGGMNEVIKFNGFLVSQSLLIDLLLFVIEVI